MKKKKRRRNRWSIDACKWYVGIWGDKIIDEFKNGIFLSKHLRKLDDAAHDFVLEDKVLFKKMNWWQKKLI